MYEQFTGCQIAIVNECDVKQCTRQIFNFKKTKLAKYFFRKLICCRESI